MHRPDAREQSPGNGHMRRQMRTTHLGRVPDRVRVQTEVRKILRYTGAPHARVLRRPTGVFGDRPRRDEVSEQETVQLQHSQGRSDHCRFEMI